MSVSDQMEAYLGHFPDAELVLGICSPLGTKYGPVVDALKHYLEQFEYSTNVIKLSDQFDDLLELLGELRLVQSSRALSRSKQKFKQAI